MQDATTSGAFQRNAAVYAVHILLLICLLGFTSESKGQVYASSLDAVPPGWAGNVFELSKDYPTSVPTKDPMPWTKIDFKKQPKAYMLSVLGYFVEGNPEVNWKVQDNAVRKWYHAPSMSWQPERRPYGREFIRGMTRERNSDPEELYPTQKVAIQNWAVGFYNPTGAYTFGKVWADTTTPVVSEGSFPEGSVACKLLFTAATLAEVPFLANSLVWTANIHEAVKGTTIRKPQEVRLLQVDIAIKDKRAGKTCWVFGTFAYHDRAPGATVWERLMPVGLMWGNDPGKFKGEKLEETWINPEFVTLFKFPDGRFMHLGYQGRLNGPVDNKNSSCLSCHSTAQYPQFNQLVPNINKPSDVKLFFRNISCDEAFSDPAKSQSMDYSLQLSGGIAAAYINRQRTTESFVKGEASSSTNHVFTSMDDDMQEEITPPKKGSGPWLWMIGGIVLFYILYKIGKSSDKEVER